MAVIETALFFIGAGASVRFGWDAMGNTMQGAGEMWVAFWVDYRRGRGK